MGKIEERILSCDILMNNLEGRLFILFFIDR